MIKEYKKLIHEIRKVREQLNECIEENGINEGNHLIEINNRLDELIVKWMKIRK